MMRAGKIKGIGVSNFSVKILTELLKHAEIVPATNRIERLHTVKIAILVRFCQRKGIVVSAYSFQVGPYRSCPRTGTLSL